MVHIISPAHFRYLHDSRNNLPCLNLEPVGQLKECDKQKAKDIFGKLRESYQNKGCYNEKQSLLSLIDYFKYLAKVENLFKKSSDYDEQFLFNFIKEIISNIQIQHHIDLNQDIDLDLGSPIMYAATENAVVMAEALMQLGVTAKSIFPLHAAAIKGHILAVDFLLDKGFDINAQNSDSETPLSYAVPHPEMVMHLIQKGALVNGRVNNQNDIFYTHPLTRAIHFGYTKSAKILMDHGAKLEEEDHSFWRKSTITAINTTTELFGHQGSSQAAHAILRITRVVNLLHVIDGKPENKLEEALIALKPTQKYVPLDDILTNIRKLIQESKETLGEDLDALLTQAVEQLKLV